MDLNPIFAGHGRSNRTILVRGESPRCPGCFRVSYSEIQPVGTTGNWLVSNKSCWFSISKMVILGYLNFVANENSSYTQGPLCIWYFQKEQTKKPKPNSRCEKVMHS